MSVTNSPEPSVGIAMCTCNGMAFLDAQLRSLTDQSRLPDRIVVSDDRSDDGTWEHLVGWRERVHASTDVQITLLRNEKRLGVTRNFEQAISALDTSIIFLADQDDVWAHDKIAVMSSYLGSHPEVLLAHSDAELIDEDDRDLGQSLFQSLYLSSIERSLIQHQRFFEVYCRRNLVTGTAAAFRRELLSLALPMPSEWLHDEWLAACAAAWQAVAMLPEKLVRYRQHGRNAIGVPTGKISWIAAYVKRAIALPRDRYLMRKIERFEVLHQRLGGTPVVRADALALLVQAEQHFIRRRGFPRNPVGRVAAVVREARTEGYRRFADGVAGMLRDIVNR
ncbi:glycosyltransferase family 2 protein [Paraburkholderia tropica]|uniref:Glycosyl transferase family 2 n=1 Tax=Paraburkholderia tropica TaxID=92647 RepID=A0ABX5MP01_9BURK|nr:glycosyltransferase family 2 protein [Paraburkholderia tropica]MDE1141892.1 glycosyltransferase family 2 protein [Paraburkholderia tropica]PXX16198.1 glycosyl transferase family 2 [Paraburkholderia tropica]PZW82590.1 glycosyl transferase family 2 [Paraburkholderia tropica]